MTKSIHYSEGGKLLLRKYLYLKHAHRCKNLSLADVAILDAVLDRRSDKDGIAYPSLEKIAVDANVCRKTASRGVNRLCETSYLTRARGKAGGKPHVKSNVYRLGPIWDTYDPTTQKFNWDTLVPSKETDLSIFTGTGLTPKLITENLSQELSIEEERFGSKERTFAEWQSQLVGKHPIPDEHNLWFCAAEAGLDHEDVLRLWQLFAQQRQHDCSHRSEDWVGEFFKFLNRRIDQQEAADAYRRARDGE